MTYNEIEAAGLNSFKKLATAVVSVLFFTTLNSWSRDSTQLNNQMYKVWKKNLDFMTFMFWSKDVR